MSWGWIECGRVCIVWLGFPCESWTLARKFDGGPPPLRSYSELWGRSAITSQHDLEKIKIGNALLVFTGKTIKKAVYHRVPGGAENPDSARSWTALDTVASTDGVIRDRSTDYCPFGTAWRKRTKVRHWLVNLDGAMIFCKSNKGICDYTGKRHIQLVGKDAAGVYLTFRAQPYPPSWCEKIVQCFLHALTSLSDARIFKLLS